MTVESRTYTHFDPANPPPVLMTGESGSFAERTMATRKPKVIRDLLADHAGLYPDDIVRGVQRLLDELVNNQTLRPLPLGTNVPDAADWQQAWQAHRGKRWLDIPWYFAESFLYRRLMEAVGYFSDREGAGVDPFLPRKQEELAGETAWGVLASALGQSADNTPESLGSLLHYGVWGNRVDLSYQQVVESTGGQIALEQEKSNLLVDDTEAVLEYLQGGRGAGEQRRVSPPLPRSPAPLPGSIQFVCDNAGTELLTDLALTDFLLRFKWAARITLHVKAHPTYVSDTIPADVDLTLAAMKAQGRSDFADLARRLERYCRQQRLWVRPDFFWNSSHFFWEFPPVLREELRLADLVVIKGDANYRRLLGDSRWPTTVPIENAVPYFPAPFVALRTLKSDPIVGLRPGQAEALDREDAEWRVNGKRGMVQAVMSSTGRL